MRNCKVNKRHCPLDSSNRRLQGTTLKLHCGVLSQVLLWTEPHRAVRWETLGTRLVFTRPWSLSWSGGRILQRDFRHFKRKRWSKLSQNKKIRIRRSPPDTLPVSMLTMQRVKRDRLTDHKASCQGVKVTMCLTWLRLLPVCLYSCPVSLPWKWVFVFVQKHINRVTFF